MSVKKRSESIFLPELQSPFSNSLLGISTWMLPLPLTPLSSQHPFWSHIGASASHDFPRHESRASFLTSAYHLTPMPTYSFRSVNHSPKCLNHWGKRPPICLFFSILTVESGIWRGSKKRPGKLCYRSNRNIFVQGEGSVSQSHLTKPLLPGVKMGVTPTLQGQGDH